VKNITEPVPVYGVKLDGTPVRRKVPVVSRLAWSRTALIALTAILVGGAAWLTLSFRESPTASVPAVVEDKPSLAVLPFANLSDDKEQGYLAEGMADDLTTELARV
jgi:adenylate cyclase